MNTQQPGSNGTRFLQNASPFNPTEHLIQIKGHNGMSDYLPVQWRLVWFRSVYPNGSIETEMLLLDLDREVETQADVWNEEKQQTEKVTRLCKGVAVFKATIRDGQGGVGTGTRSESAANFPDFIEAAETGAIGRALASLGFGTQFAPELQEQHRIVDSPVARTQPAASNGRRSAPAPVAGVAEKRAEYSVGEQLEGGRPITEAQMASVHRLYERLGKVEPANIHDMDFLAAKELIARLSQEYRQAHSKIS